MHLKFKLGYSNHLPKPGGLNINIIILKMKKKGGVSNSWNEFLFKGKERKNSKIEFSRQPKAGDPVDTEDPQRPSGFSVSLDPACTLSFYRILPVTSTPHFFSRLNRSPLHDQNKKEKKNLCLLFTKTATDNFSSPKLPIRAELISYLPPSTSGLPTNHG